ncbi:MAG: serine hydrolase domain-containing protein, partial [Thermoanaerobaculia bacterium]|nr:serine hydrolase domain-containing protein [Thermoanaerobaculia bacterium]
DPDLLPSRPLGGSATAFVDAVEEGRALARSLAAEEKLPGLSLAVALEGGIVWAEGFGWAELDSRTPVTPATLFRIGGVSESLTSAAVGLLSDRGRLDLDAPVGRYLPDLPGATRVVTTRQAMAHAAGIRSYRGEEEIFRRIGCADDSERLAIFAGDRLRFPPGSARRYSPYGWVLVGAVVAAVAGESYVDFVRREILVPLGMESTMPEVAGASTSESAHPYYPRLMLDPRWGLQDAPAVDLSCILPAGGFLSTPSDLVRFGSAMTAGGLLEPATLEELETPVRTDAGSSSDSSVPSGEQALGWSVRRVPLGPDGNLSRIVGRGLEAPVRRSLLSATTVGGQVPGATTSLLLVPEHGIVIAVASNVSGAETVSSLALGLAEIFVRRPGAG